MTEDEWLAADNPCQLLQVVSGTKPSERRVRLFNAAICRRFLEHLPEASLAILKESELLADGLTSRPADPMELCGRANEAVSPFHRLYPTKQFPNDEIRIQRAAAVAVCYAVIPNDLFGAFSAFVEIEPSEQQPQAQLIRDIFGNPFRPVSLNPTWLKPNVVALAQTIYDGRAFDRFPELADALIAAGCDNQDMLNHCRTAGPHVRGCWVVDLVLGKE